MWRHIAADHVIRLLRFVRSMTTAVVSSSHSNGQHPTSGLFAAFDCTRRCHIPLVQPSGSWPTTALHLPTTRVDYRSESTSDFFAVRLPPQPLPSCSTRYSSRPDHQTSGSFRHHIAEFRPYIVRSSFFNLLVRQFQSIWVRHYIFPFNKSSICAFILLHDFKFRSRIEDFNFKLTNFIQLCYVVISVLYFRVLFV
jgi:hypothetical protein